MRLTELYEVLKDQQLWLISVELERFHLSPQNVKKHAKPLNLNRCQKSEGSRGRFWREFLMPLTELYVVLKDQQLWINIC